MGIQKKKKKKKRQVVNMRKRRGSTAAGPGRLKDREGETGSISVSTDLNTYGEMGQCLKRQTTQTHTGGAPHAAQWAESLSAAAPVTAEVQVQSPARHSGLKDPATRHCLACSLDSVPDPGTSIGHGAAVRFKKKKKKIKKEKKKRKKN